MNNIRFLYSDSINNFLDKDIDYIIGYMDRNSHGNIMTTTRESWASEVEIMKSALKQIDNADGQIIFEYDIPRLGKRIDVVLLIKGIIFCLEFKVGESKRHEEDLDQVLDYALDLRNFHKLSQDKLIVPILVPTNHKTRTTDIQISGYDSRIINPLVGGEKDIAYLVNSVVEKYPYEEALDINWVNSPYSPTPTIIEAARALYNNHSVENITKHEADEASTDATISYILDVIKESKEKQQKSICFVTGVPGSGKTLVGLDVAIKQTYQGNDEPVKNESAVYLSGNGPLVAVLKEALAQDNYKRCREAGKRKRLTDSRREVEKSIQMIHRYRDTMLNKIKNPVENGILEIDPSKAIKTDESGYAEVEHVAIFDEAQRSWTHKRLADYLKRGGTYGNKLKVPNLPMSEAAFLIWSLDQREDWATIVCLVGGGQEINTGEAGISEWLKAINDKYPHWNVYISSKLTDKEYADGNVNEILKNKSNVIYSDCLHLSVSQRSFRAENLSKFINELLNFDNKASYTYNKFKDKYTIYLTRDMDKAREWLHSKAGGSERTGVLITKESARFKPLGIHVLQSGDDNAIHWFLDDKESVNSSNYLEDAATEIQVQGLELDYACILWDADMRYEDGKWRYFSFNGKTSKWNEQKGDTESNQEKIKYMLNAYRVLLTRARIGMIICVPYGNSNKTPLGYPEDKTRLPEFYNGTYEYLKSLGIEEI